MFASVLRFILKGWVYELYVAPKVFFSYYGFEWIQPMGEQAMFFVFLVMLFASLSMMFGFRYKLSATLFFLTWTYVELLDKTNYLNHYYFVSIIAFLMILVPAHRNYSIDSWLNPGLKVASVPAWTIDIFKLQLGLLYLFAGVAKLNPDWLLEAMPMRIWLPANEDLFLIGPLFRHPETAFAFSWAGAIYDLTIPFFLLFARTRLFAYVAVVFFHLMTGMLFQIGMFPYIMILATLIFFPAKFHRRILDGLMQILSRIPKANLPKRKSERRWNPRFGKLIMVVLAIHFVFQIVMPFRYVLYPDNLFWTEEGFRFSWRVMLMEKAGHATFYVEDPETGARTEVSNDSYLTVSQEKMMATQPDMILQYAHMIRDDFENRGLENPKVFADIYVGLNGRGSRMYIDPNVDLAMLNDGWNHKDWILDPGN